MFRDTGERIQMFRPNLDNNWAGTSDSRLAIFLAGNHPEVANVPIEGTALTRQIGETYQYPCPYSNESRTLWAIKGSEADLLRILTNFARDNSPVPAAQRFIAERTQRVPAHR